MDPTVQVAMVSVLATAITTAGVVIVAIINNKRERSGAADTAVDLALDDSVILKRLVELINENDDLEKKNRELRSEIRSLKLELKALTPTEEEAHDQ